MARDITVEAVAREGVGKGPARRLRTKGLIPVAVYGESDAPAAVAVEAKAIANILRSGTGHNTVFTLNVPGMEPANVIIKDWQVDPLKGRLVHADLLRLSMTTVTRVSVPIVLVGDSVGVKLEGGILEIELREVEVECLPGDIPERIEVEVAGLHIGQHVTVADLRFDREKIKPITPEDHVVAGVLAPRMVEEVAPAAAEAEGVAAAEPEVIKKGKTEESA
ncbi:MAG TPA: 50S ribosomal protein L25 [Blastocatellia bacterium]